MPGTEAKSSRRGKALAARRRQILEAAVMCFLDAGYHQTGVRDIASRAGVSLGNLYNHFPSKHDVLIEIAQLERAELDPFIRQLAKPGSARKGFDRFVVDYAKYLSATENVILTVEISSEAIRKPDLGTLFTDNRQALVVALQDLLERGQSNAEFELPAEARHVAAMVLELIEGRAYHSVLSSTAMRKLLPALQALLHAALGVSTD